MAKDVLSITDNVLGTTEDVLGIIEDVLGIITDGPRPLIHPLLHRNLAKWSLKTMIGGLGAHTW